MRPLILAGATGSGKTAVAIEAARLSGAEIVSADSRQIYRRFNAGTAKPEGRWEKVGGVDRFVAGGVVHHLVDFIEPTEFYTAGRFAKDAAAALRDIESRGKKALVVGGTGLYLRALARGLAPLPERDDQYRRKMEAVAAEKGRPFLHGELRKVDPAAAANIPPQNLHRVIRALEVHHLTGVPISEMQKRTPAPAWDFRWFGLRWPRAALEARLRQRCGEMARAGLLKETEALLAAGVPAEAPAFQSLGYREAAARLRGEMTDAEWADAFFLATRQYAKRQDTWFRGETGVRWLELSSEESFAPAAGVLASQLS